MKHAYLIMAHNDFDILKKLIQLLDDENNDFYIHIDKKVKNFNFEAFVNIVKKSKIYFIDRTNISWGGDSQIFCELKLLKCAIESKYDYYHLLSGVDLPLKSKKEINDYFCSNNGKEFIRFDSKAASTNEHIERIKYFYFYQNEIGRSKNIFTIFLKILQKLLIKIQKILKINRISESSIIWSKGPNWFDITHSFAEYLLSQKEFIEKHFKNTYCADEVLLQTIVLNSSFSNNICTDRIRYVDWNRGKPYTFTINEFDELINSGSLFARKFSSTIDKKIIEEIYLKFINE